MLQEMIMPIPHAGITIQGEEKGTTSELQLNSVYSFRQRVAWHSFTAELSVQ